MENRLLGVPTRNEDPAPKPLDRTLIIVCGLLPKTDLFILRVIKLISGLLISFGKISRETLISKEPTKIVEN